MCIGNKGQEGTDVSYLKKVNSQKSPNTKLNILQKNFSLQKCSHIFSNIFKTIQFIYTFSRTCLLHKVRYIYLSAMEARKPFLGQFTPDVILKD